MESDYQDFNATSYSISNDTPYDLARIDYEYSQDNFLSFWKVYQASEETQAYTLPTLPADFLNDITIESGRIDQPRRIHSHYFELEIPIGSNGFNENRVAIRDCDNYQDTYDSAEF